MKKTFKILISGIIAMCISSAEAQIGGRGLQVLQSAGMACSEYTNGTYVGDMKNGKPDGYGMYLLPDSTYYVGRFVNGKLNGSGFLYRSDKKLLSVSSRIDGKVKGDYVIIYPALRRVELQHSKDSGTSEVSVIMFAGPKYNIITDIVTKEKYALVTGIAGPESGDFYYAPNLKNNNQHGKNIIFDAYKNEARIQLAEEGDYKSTLSTYSLVANHDDDLAREIGSPLPSWLRGVRQIEKYKGGVRTFMGMTNGTDPAGYSIVTSPYYIRSGWPAAPGQTLPLVREVETFSQRKDAELRVGYYNMSSRDGYTFREGEGIVANFTENGGLELFLGTLVVDNNKTKRLKGLYFGVKSNGTITASIYQTDDLQTGNGQGYIMLPKSGILYRGDVTNSTANGYGEMIRVENNIYQSGLYEQGKFITQKLVNVFPLYQYEHFFDKPFERH